MVELACIGVLVSRPRRLAIGDGPDGGLLHPAMCPSPMQCIAVCRWVGWRQLVAARWRHLLRNSPTEPHNQSQTVGQDTDQLTLDRWLAFHSIPVLVRKNLSTSSLPNNLYQYLQLLVGHLCWHLVQFTLEVAHSKGSPPFWMNFW